GDCDCKEAISRHFDGEGKESRVFILDRFIHAAGGGLNAHASLVVALDLEGEGLALFLFGHQEAIVDFACLVDFSSWIESRRRRNRDRVRAEPITSYTKKDANCKYVPHDSLPMVY